MTLGKVAKYLFPSLWKLSDDSPPGGFMVEHSTTDLNVFLCYKNFGACQGISHIGLGVSALNTSKNLQEMGIRAQVFALKDDQALKDLLANADPLPTHVNIAAPWILTTTFQELCAMYPDTQFSMTSHSNVGFLQADINGISLIKQALDLEGGTSNFHLAGNSREFQNWVENTFKAPCTYLPNLYYLHDKMGQGDGWSWDGGSLRIGCFGATRIQKNFVSAVAAAMEIASWTGVQTQIWINSGRDDGPESNRLRLAIGQLVSEMPNVSLQLYNWSSWGAFKRLLGTMNLLIQPSYTESFNMVTADGIVMGVPSVVSDAITWAPDNWMARVDDTTDIARTGLALLSDPTTLQDGVKALKGYVRDGRRAWVDYLAYNRFGEDLSSLD